MGYCKSWFKGWQTHWKSKELTQVLESETETELRAWELSLLDIPFSQKQGFFFQTLQ